MNAKPPAEVVLVGYWLTEARTALRLAQGPYDGNAIAWGFAYLTSAVAAIEPAREALEAQLENRQTIVSDGEQEILDACQALAGVVGSAYPDLMEVKRISAQIGKGHFKFARAMGRLGFDPITNEDFDALRAPEEKLPGGGGGR